MHLALHGIKAYRKPVGSLAMVQRAEKCVSGVEICASDRAIGSVGLVLSGFSSATYSQDVWSYTQNGGERLFGLVCDYHRLAGEYCTCGDSDFPHIARTHGHHSTLEFSKWCSDALEESGARYCETFFSAHQIEAVWVKSWASEKDRKVARVIARKYKVMVLVINDSDSERIGVLADKYNLSARYAA